MPGMGGGEIVRYRANVDVVFWGSGPEVGTPGGLGENGQPNIIRRGGVRNSLAGADRGRRGGVFAAPHLK